MYGSNIGQPNSVVNSELRDHLDNQSKSIGQTRFLSKLKSSNKVELGPEEAWHRIVQTGLNRPASTNERHSRIIHRHTGCQALFSTSTFLMDTWLAALCPSSYQHLRYDTKTALSQCSSIQPSKLLDLSSSWSFSSCSLYRTTQQKRGPCLHYQDL